MILAGLLAMALIVFANDRLRHGVRDAAWPAAVIRIAGPGFLAGAGLS